MRLRQIVVLAGLAFGVSSVAPAQFSQYTPPGTFERAPEDMKDGLQDAIAGARWRIGRAYWDPWLGLRDVSWIENVGQRAEGVPLQSDFTATLGVGLRGYMPVGSESVLAIHLLPEYVWFNDLDERRRLNGRYGLGLFGDFGKTGIELQATREDNSRFFSREFEERVNLREDRASVSLQIELGKGFSLFGGGAFEQISFEEVPGDPILSTLDRDEQLGRAGLRYESETGLLVGIGVERSDVEFEQRGSDRSNSGTSPVLELEFDRQRVSLGGELVLRDLEPKTGPQRIAFDGVTGHFRLEWRAANFAALEAYTRNDLVYSFQTVRAYFEDSAVGLALRTSLGSRASLRVFAENGENDYVAFEETTPDRIDDLQAYGAEISLKLGRTTFILGGSRTRYESTLPEFDRVVRTARIDLVFGTKSRLPWF